VSKLEKPHCSLEFDYSNELPKLVFADGGRLLKLSFARSPAADWNDELFGSRGGVRGKCKGFSFGSRRRMMNRLNSVSVAATLPQFVTMTLPDDVFDDNCSTFAKTAKGYLDTFLKRLARVCPDAAGFWRIEWQTRKSGKYEGKLVPHFHLLVWGLPERVLGERDVYREGEYCGTTEVRECYVDCLDRQRQFEMVGLLVNRPVPESWERKVETEFQGRRVEFGGSEKYVNRVERLLGDAWLAECSDRLDPANAKPHLDRARFMSFSDWAALAWYHVVASGNLDHLTAGVRCERVKTWRGVMSYCAKYMAKRDCDFLSDVQFGRSWGIFNRKSVPWAKMVELELDQETGVRLRRVARRYLEQRLGSHYVSKEGKRLRRRWQYGLTLFCDIDSFRKLWERPPPDPF